MITLEVHHISHTLMTLTSVANTVILLTCDILFNSFPPLNKSLPWQCKTEMKTPWLIRGISGYTWWYVDKIKFETEEWGDGGRVEGIEVSSVEHEEQHLRWLGQGPKGLSEEDLVWTQTPGDTQRWGTELGVGVWGTELIPGFRLRQSPGQGHQAAECGPEWMAEGSKGRVYLQQVFPLGTDKT